METSLTIQSEAKLYVSCQWDTRIFFKKSWGTVECFSWSRRNKIVFSDNGEGNAVTNLFNIEAVQCSPEDNVRHLKRESTLVKMHWSTSVHRLSQKTHIFNPEVKIIPNLSCELQFWRIVFMANLGKKHLITWSKYLVVLYHFLTFCPKKKLSGQDWEWTLGTVVPKLLTFVQC